MSSLPLSGQVIGAVLRALRISSDDLRAGGDGPSARTIRDYFEGRPVSRESRLSILGLVAQLAAEADLLAGPSGYLSLPHDILDLVLEYADSWDHLVTTWRVYRRPPAAQNAAAAAILRILAIDLGVRASGLSVLVGSSPPEVIPEWVATAVASDGRPGFLPLLLRRGGLTRDGFLMRLGAQVSESAVDQHLSGAKRPDGENTLELYAATLAGVVPGTDQAQLAGELRLHFALQELGSVVAAQTGWPLLGELAGQLHRVWTMAWGVIQRAPAEGRTHAALSHLAYGAAATGPRWPDWFLGQLPDARWREAARGALGDWSGFMRFAVARQDRLGDQPYDWSVPADTAASCYVNGIAAQALLKDDAAIPLLRRACELDPADPEFHLELGSALACAHLDDGPVGERLRLLEARASVRRALELRPGWEEALLEEAFLVEMLEGPEAALSCLESMASWPRKGDDGLLRYHLAVMALGAGRPESALAMLQPLIGRGSVHAHALELAAACHGAMGNEGRASAARGRAAGLGRS